MLLFVEGIDKSGKTTFIKNLSSLIGFPIYRKSPAKDLRLEGHHNYFKGIGYALLELHSIFKYDLIVDRSFISDYIYSNRNSKSFSLQIWRNWENRIASDEVLIFNLRISKETFFKRIALEPDQYMDRNEYDYYVSLYEEYFKMTKFTTIPISGDISFHEQVLAIKKVLANSTHPFENRFNSLHL